MKKIFKSVAEVEKEFFPTLYKERMESHLSNKPKDVGARIAKEILNEAKQQILK